MARLVGIEAIKDEAMAVLVGLYALARDPGNQALVERTTQTAQGLVDLIDAQSANKSEQQ